MKKIFTTFVLLLVFTFGFSQNENEAPTKTPDAEDEKSNFSIDYYFGVGLLYTDALDINPFLSESNVPTVRRFPFEIALGMTGNFGKNRIDFEIGFYNQEREDAGFGHKMVSTQLTLRYLRKVLEFENKNEFFVGSGLMLGSYELEFFDKSESIDLTDAGSFGDIAKLDNAQFYLSPSVGYSIISSEDNHEFLRLQLSYELNLTGNSWESEYARVNNSIDEKGNRWRLQAIFPF
jgi:hypothetical protein